jgi:transcription termination factor Rho
MVLAELQELAAGMGIAGTTRMRKSQLIEAIKAKQGDGGRRRTTAMHPRLPLAPRVTGVAGPRRYVTRWPVTTACSRPQRPHR